MEYLVSITLTRRQILPSLSRLGSVMKIKTNSMCGHVICIFFFQFWIENAGGDVSWISHHFDVKFFCVAWSDHTYHQKILVAVQSNSDRLSMDTYIICITPAWYGKLYFFQFVSGLKGLLKIWIIDVIHMSNVPGYNVFTPPIAEILCVINPRAIVVCGFLIK